jgi:phospholipase/carboxylesterase
MSGCGVLPDGAGPEAVKPEIKARPPILLLHGDRDDLIPVPAMLLSAQYLAALDIPAEWHMSPGIGHGIDEEGLRHGGAFLARQLMRKR